MKRFSTLEDLDESNKYKCTTCKKEQKCSKTSIVFGFPPILIIHLKRFEVKGYISKSKKTTSIKIEGQINFEFKNGEYIRNAKYSLFGVINHSGSISFGHYTADCLGIEDKKWYNISDTHVSLSSNPGEHYSSECYILFYKKIN